MGRIFGGERFGRPQFLAGLLLLVFLAQALWLVDRRLSHFPVSGQSFVIREGWGQWRGKWIAGAHFSTRLEEAGVLPWVGDRDGFDPDHAALWYLVASVPLAWLGDRPDFDARAGWGWLAAVPTLLFGGLLGASLWYVSRRLYGNAGGYIALTLYCFSPRIICNAALWFSEPELGAAWGAFGALFTAIAVAHTLYAPREVVLWNWRRILLLGLSLALAVGSQFSLAVLLPICLGFMLYLAPMRRGAAFAILVAACLGGLMILFASYFFHFGMIWQAMRHASFWGISARAFTMSGAYRQAAEQFGQSSPALVLAFPGALIAYMVWPRARYFGNTAPLLVALLFLVLGLGTPHYPGLGFHLVALPFLFAFVAGVAADLLETRQQSLVLACIAALLGASAVWNIWQLARVAGG